ncbi:hypothetical protein ABH294_14855, partial [Acinetobacter pittii]|uniref:hypothetical protein n=1 Tax=Acinetobacter TaxID=469 RepID=UPI001F431933
GIAQLVEHNLAKVGVASSSLVSRSKFRKPSSKDGGFFIVDFIRFFKTRKIFRLLSNNVYPNVFNLQVTISDQKVPSINQKDKNPFLKLLKKLFHRKFLCH